MSLSTRFLSLMRIMAVRDWRRTLEKKRLFLKNRKYEPWLSLELIANEEPRFYGMKVLANYIIYQELLGHKVDIESLLKQALRY